MRPRRWKVEERLEIVVEGLKEKKPIAEICREHHRLVRRFTIGGEISFWREGKKGLSMGLRMIMPTRLR